MAAALKIAYIGGGSYFTQHLLHGLGGRAGVFRELGCPVELALMDIVPANAEPRRRYAEVAARQTGLDLTATITADRAAAVDGADWVIFSICPPRDRHERFARLCEPLGEVSCESAPAAAAEAAALWPVLRELADDLRRLSPDALFATLVNPTDVIAGAFQKAFGIRSIGMCVEVPQLQCWLAHYLKVQPRDIVLEHVGGNHVGWVTRCTAAGKDGTALFARVLDEVQGTDQWDRTWDWFADAFRWIGHLPTSPYHNWPHRREWDEEGHQRYHAACGPDSGREYRRRLADEAAVAGRMVPELEPPAVPYESRSFNWMNTRHTLGAVAVGLAGAQAGPVPLQVENASSNADLPADDWLEVPTRIEGRTLKPLTVSPPPPDAFAQLAGIIRQRKLLADWLAGGSDAALLSGLLAYPDGTPEEKLEAFAAALTDLAGDDA